MSSTDFGVAMARAPGKWRSRTLSPPAAHAGPLLEGEADDQGGASV
ncbi:MAG TPA: hypothetical protein VN969_20680 [Streptosporangiaceae bacterium]|nr:hypothetical protein [Streptosporangiaceae bacterium]